MVRLTLSPYASDVRLTTTLSPDEPLPPEAMVLTFQTNVPNQSVRIPVVNVGTFNAVIDWGDGQVTPVNFYSDINLNHTYTDPGEYVVQITGSFPNIWFNNKGDRLRLMEINQIGDTGLIQLNRGFYGCAAMRLFTAGPIANLSGVTELRNTWKKCSNMPEFPLIDTSAVTIFVNTWRGCTGLTAFPLIDTSSGGDFSHAWRSCFAMAMFPLLDMSSGVNFTATWRDCRDLTAFPVIDMPSGRIFTATWRGCTGLTAFPVVDVSDGRVFSATWMDCSGLTAFPLLDVSSATTFANAWCGCSSMVTFPPNMFDTTTTGTFTNAFANTALDETSIDGILTSLVTAGQSNGTFGQSGGSAPSTVGEAAIDTLRARGWGVSVTGGY